MFSDDDFPPEQPLIDLDPVDDALRKVGLYLDSSDQHPEEPTVFRIVCLVGDLAFASRVQDPMQSDFDQQFRAMVADQRASEFEDTRKALLEGRDFLDL